MNIDRPIRIWTSHNINIRRLNPIIIEILVEKCNGNYESYLQYECLINFMAEYKIIK